MSFHLTAENLRLEENHILIAQLRNADGDLVDSSIDLDTVLGNVDGRLEWGGQNFSENAKEVQFGIESEAEIPILRAVLKNDEEEVVAADVNLSERIVNENGAFAFV